MRRISKGNEPTSLTEHRCNPPATYDNYGYKDALRESLVAEQRGLCCYCLSPIHATNNSMKIEHWHCQSKYPNEQLDYRNLLGSCKGNEGSAFDAQHCDTRKGDADIKWNPANPDHPVEQFVFFENGRVKSRDPEFDKQINEVLNLNVAFLVNERKAVLDSLAKALPRQGTWSRTTLERLLRDWNGDSNTSELAPYCQVVVYWIRKRLGRAN